jgi:hypothetical protein
VDGEGPHFYEIARREEDDWYPNQFLYLPATRKPSCASRA